MYEMRHAVGKITTIELYILEKETSRSFRLFSELPEFFNSDGGALAFLAQFSHFCEGQFAVSECQISKCYLNYSSVLLQLCKHTILNDIWTPNNTKNTMSCFVEPKSLV